jgi:hypothetical protein
MLERQKVAIVPRLPLNFDSPIAKAGADIFGRGDSLRLPVGGLGRAGLPRLSSALT